MAKQNQNQNGKNNQVDTQKIENNSENNALENPQQSSESPEATKSQSETTDENTESGNAGTSKTPAMDKRNETQGTNKKGVALSTEAATIKSRLRVTTLFECNGYFFTNKTDANAYAKRVAKKVTVY